MRRLDPRKLVFLDETSTRVGMRREHAYAPIGQRAHAGFLRNFGLNRTLLVAISLEGVLPSFLVDGGLTRPVFEYYLRELLLPALTPGRVLVLDNYVVHKGDSVAALAAERGVELRYLPAYSPDLNPIEAMFSKLKAHLRKAAAMTIGALSLATKGALDAVTLTDIQGFYSLLGFPRQAL
jgi:transposase